MQYRLKVSVQYRSYKVIVKLKNKIKSADTDAKRRMKDLVKQQCKLMLNHSDDGSRIKSNALPTEEGQLSYPQRYHTNVNISELRLI